MIPKAFINAWRERAPWRIDAQVEQDLVISRALVEMYAVPELRERLAFRGGTALYKLHLLPPARCSEDIDLVQVDARPIGETLNIVRGVLDPWLGTPQRKFKEGRVNLVYRFESEDSPPLRMRLKIEINTREHFTELGLVRAPLNVEGRWFAGAADVTTFDVNELMGTKLRALYQRKKGRDLFDMAHALQRDDVDPAVLLRCFGPKAATTSRGLSSRRTSTRSRPTRTSAMTLRHCSGRRSSGTSKTPCRSSSSRSSRSSPAIHGREMGHEEH